MADYFTKFSLVLPLPNEAAQQYALNLHQQAKNAQQGDEPPKDFPVGLRDGLEDWFFEMEADTVDNKPALWLHSDYGGIEAVCGFLQHLLRKFDPEGRITFEWSHDCTKPRVDAYGGGAAIITARRIKTMSTSQWIRRHSK